MVTDEINTFEKSFTRLIRMKNKTHAYMHTHSHTHILAILGRENGTPRRFYKY